jgi:hypothetical protein
MSRRFDRRRLRNEARTIASTIGNSTTVSVASARMPGRPAAAAEPDHVRHDRREDEAEHHAHLARR